MVRTWLSDPAVDPRLSILIEVNPDRSARLIVLSDGALSATRNFDSLPSSCVDRRAILALTTALAIDAAVLTPLVEAIQPEPESTVNRAEERFALELTVDGGLALDWLPNIAAFGTLGVGLRIDDLVRVSVGAMVTSAVDLSLGAGSAETRLAAGRLEVCLTRSADFVEVGGCVGGAAGTVLVEGRGFDLNYDSALPWGALFAGAEVAAWIDRLLGFGVRVEGLAPLGRTEFRTLASDGTLEESRRLPVSGVGISLGAHLRLR